MKTILAIAAISLFLISLATAQNYFAVINDPKGFVEIRERPNVKSRVKGKIPEGGDFLVVGGEGEWQQVVYIGQTGQIRGYLPISKIKRMDSRTVRVNGVEITYRLVIVGETKADIPVAIPTYDRAYSRNPYNGKIMYFGFLRTQAIIKDSESGKEFFYTRYTLEEKEKADQKYANAQQRAKIFRTIDRVGGDLLREARNAPKCGVCGGTGATANGLTCSTCGGTGKSLLP